MQTITIPIGKGRSDLCALIERVQNGDQVIFTSHGQPKAVLTNANSQAKPWRTAGDPSRFGDLQTPVLEEWQ